MTDVPTSQSLLEFLVVAQHEAIEKQEQVLKTLPASVGYSEQAACIKSEIAELEGRADRLSRMIDPTRPNSGTSPEEITA